MKGKQLPIAVIVALLLATPAGLQAQTPVGTAFTYQGQLKQAGSPLAAARDSGWLLADARGSLSAGEFASSGFASWAVFLRGFGSAAASSAPEVSPITLIGWPSEKLVER